MRLDPRTPVVVGVAQVVHKVTDLDEIVDALALMERALVGAAEDAGTTRVLGALDRIAVMQGRWRWSDPARLLADRVGADRATSVMAMASGSIAQDLVVDAATRILAGGADAVAVCGGEWTNGRRRLRAAERPLPVTKQAEVEPDERYGVNREWETPAEVARGFTEPLVAYAMYESAIAAARGEDVAATRDRVAAIVAQLNRVAVKAPIGWRQEPRSEAEIREPTAANRLVVTPYTKWMVANPDVDMAFAIVVCAAEVAERLGVPADRWVFPLASAGCDDRCDFSQLPRFDRSEHHRLVGTGVLAAAGVGIDDVAHLDLYSCFPSALQLQADALGIDPLGRDITVTGGMPYFGGPLAGYMGHAIVRMAELLREEAGSLGLCHGNGGYTNKLASCLYSSEPRQRFRHVDLTAEVVALPHRRARWDAADAAIEGSTVVFDRSGPTVALVSALDAAGDRVLGSSRDHDIVEELLADPGVGRPVHIDDTGNVSLVG